MDILLRARLFCQGSRGGRECERKEAVGEREAGKQVVADTDMT